MKSFGVRVVSFFAKQFFRAVVIFFILLNSCFGEDVTSIGVYYFPGWKQEAPLIKRPPWDLIKRFPDKEPLLGWYKDGSKDVTSKQLRWMKDNHIDFVVYDWYWVPKYGVTLNHAIDSFIEHSKTTDIDFAILWANHTDTPSSLRQFDEVVAYWLKKYFVNSNYKKINGEPVVVIFSPESLEKHAEQFGETTKSLLARARQQARNEGFKGIYFISNTAPIDNVVKKILPDATYDALTAYNYQSAPSLRQYLYKQSRSYAELSDAYQENWSWMINNSPLPYLVPATSGWDRRPWGGSTDPLHDSSISTPEEFDRHMHEAITTARSNKEKTHNTVIICCWNEYGEGSYIEPTKKYRFRYLDAIKRNFLK